MTRFDKVLPYPKNIGIIIHENNFSTTEEFILRPSKVKKQEFFGRKTGGALDVSNMVEITDPEKQFYIRSIVFHDPCVSLNFL